MDNYFLVKWKEDIIGFLARIDNIYYTRFQTKHLSDQKLGEDIIKQTTFQPDRLYRNPELFDFFRRRLRVEEGEDVFDRIRKTKAERPTDNYSLEEMSEEQKKQLNKVISEILILEETRGEEK